MTPDGQPFISRIEGFGNLFIGAGASGSGGMKSDASGRILAALIRGDEYAELHGNKRFKVSDLSIGEARNVQPEKLII